MTIKQKLALQKPVNKTIFVTLKNKRDAKATYQMQVNFLCNPTKNFTFNFLPKNKTDIRLEAIKN
jgi:hypothetical protein